MLVVPDIDDMFVPLNDGFLVDVAENRFVEAFGPCCVPYSLL
jgi:hypothetical protein